MVETVDVPVVDSLPVEAARSLPSAAVFAGLTSAVVVPPAAPAPGLAPAGGGPSCVVPTPGVDGCGIVLSPPAR